MLCHRGRNISRWWECIRTLLDSKQYGNGKTVLGFGHLGLPENYSGRGSRRDIPGRQSRWEAERTNTDNSAMKGRRKKEQLLGEEGRSQRNHTEKGRLEENKANLSTEGWPLGVQGPSACSTEEKTLRRRKKAASLQTWSRNLRKFPGKIFPFLQISNPNEKHSISCYPALNLPGPSLGH